MVSVQKLRVHSKTANDFAFLNSASFIATGGQSSESRNVCLWDMLVPDNQALVKGVCVWALELRACAKTRTGFPRQGYWGGRARVCLCVLGCVCVGVWN